jgi:hypothetical protein
MPMHAPGVHVPVRVFAWVLFVLPPAFRREFGDEMTCDFTDALAEMQAVRGPAPLRLWVVAVADVLRSAPRLWLETGLPLIAGVAAVLGLAVATAAARLRPAVPIPEVTDDRDLRLLIVLVAVVLVVIANTLIVSLWFLRPLLTRHRTLTPCSKRAA